MPYNPKPTRAWSRVQSQCTFINNDSSYNAIYIPLINKTLPPGEALYYDKLQYKGNILQYKGNSIGLTKRQKYAQLAKGAGPNRTKVFATQTQTYSNPNTSSLLRVNTITYPYPNNIVGAPNNIAGPFQYNVANPFGCSTTSVVDGGSLISGVYVNSCTNAIIKDTNVVQQCFPTYCSDVPGQPELLCWNPKQQTWYPRQRLNMNNSLNKWPEGYKGLVSAVAPYAPYLMVDISNNIATLMWKNVKGNCLPVTSYNIYENGNIIANVPDTTTSYNVAINCGNNFFYITALSNKDESQPSNTVDAFRAPYFIVTNGSQTYNAITGIYTVTYNTSGTIQFFCNNPTNNPITAILVGGGGGGAGGSNTYSTTIKGGGGGGGAQTIILTTNSYVNNTLYTINIGAGGTGGLPLGGSGGSGGNGNPTILNLSTTYTSLGGEGGQASQGGDGGASGTNGGAVSEPSAIPSYSNGNGGIGVNSGNSYGGGGGGGGVDGSGPAPSASGNVAGGGGGGIAFNVTTGLITTAGGGGGGGTSGGTGYAGGIAGSLYGGTGANSDGSNGNPGTNGGGGGGGSGAQNATTSPYYGAGYGGNGGNGICILKFTLSN